MEIFGVIAIILMLGMIALTALHHGIKPVTLVMSGGTIVLMWFTF